MPDHELPASVRVALWATAALAGQVSLEQVADHALPDLDHCTGLEPTLTLWRSLGERAVLAALPRPGDLTGMPRGGPDLAAAASLAQECVFIPGLGGALVPTLAEFGPAGDRGWSVTWETFAAEPFPTHRVQALDLGQVELGLRTELALHTASLASIGGAPFGAAAERRLAEVRPTGRDDPWGLPDGIPGRAARLVGLAGTVLTLADAGLDPQLDSTDLATTTARATTLRRLQSSAASALADATNVAVLHLAGWR